MRTLPIIGIVLIAGGLFVALGGVSIGSQRSTLRVGDYQASLEEERTVPTWIGWTTVAVGAGLLGYGLRRTPGV